MARKGKTRGYYLPADLMAWLESKAKADGRSVSNLLAFLVRNAMERDA
jgi:hypothetical protein